MKGVCAVSVVMPSMNQGQYLGAAARSVLEQGGEELELVVMDGGSTDDSLRQLADLADAFPGRVRWYSGPDGGPAEAVNRAVRLARGEIIGWLNSDDLYARGAVKRAVRFLRKNSECVMVYGKARHIDARGDDLGEYPTVPPAAALDRFADGCVICQPSAFFRREAFETLGGLKTGLRAAFDFDLWLEFFLRFPGRIGFIPRVQAYSRLHDQCITRRFRERVAFEGMSVVARHLGRAPAHWMLTHFEELMAAHPFHAERTILAAEVNRLASLAEPYLSPDGARLLQERVAGDGRVEMARPELFVGVEPDRWAGPRLEVRLLQGARPWREIVLRCRHVSPIKKPLRLEITSPTRGSGSLTIPEKGDFRVVIPVDAQYEGARGIFRVRTNDFFIPATRFRESNDTRRLAYLVEACELN